MTEQVLRRCALGIRSEFHLLPWSRSRCRRAETATVQRVWLGGPVTVLGVTGTGTPIGTATGTGIVRSLLAQWRRVALGGLPEVAAASLLRGAAVAVAGSGADRVSTTGGRLRSRTTAQRAGRLFGAAGDETGGGLVGVEVGQVVSGQLGGDVAFQDAGVFGGDREPQLVAGVGGDGVAQVTGQLREVLVGEHE